MKHPLQDIIDAIKDTGAAAVYFNPLPTEKQSSDLLTLSEAAEILGYKPSGLRKLVKRGGIRHIQIGKGPIKFRREWLDEFEGDKEPIIKKIAKRSAPARDFTPTHLKRPA